MFLLFSCLVKLTLCDPMDYSLPDSSVRGILQARILAWVAISFSRGSSEPGDRTCVSCIAGEFFTTEPPGKPLRSMRSWNIKDGKYSRSTSPFTSLWAKMISKAITLFEMVQQKSLGVQVPGQCSLS